MEIIAIAQQHAARQAEIKDRLRAALEQNDLTEVIALAKQLVGMNE